MDHAIFDMDVVMDTNSTTPLGQLLPAVRQKPAFCVLMDTFILLGTENPSAKLLQLLHTATIVLGSAALMLDNSDDNWATVVSYVSRHYPPDFIADPQWGWRFMHILRVMTDAIAQMVHFSEDSRIDGNRDYLVDEVHLATCTPLKTTLIYVLMPLF